MNYNEQASGAAAVAASASTSAESHAEDSEAYAIGTKTAEKVHSQAYILWDKAHLSSVCNNRIHNKRILTNKVRRPCD